MPLITQTKRNDKVNKTMGIRPSVLKKFALLIDSPAVYPDRLGACCGLWAELTLLVGSTYLYVTYVCTVFCSICGGS